MTIEAIFFDNDGILVDTEPLFFRATRTVIERYGGTLDEAVFVRVSLREGRNLFAEVLGIRNAETLRDRLRERDALYSRLLEGGIEPLTGVREALLALEAHDLGRAIVTSSKREHFERIHRQSRLDEAFDFVLTREDYERAKPDPEPYLAAARRAGARTDRCVAIEDSERGVRSAAAAGMRVLAIPNRLTAGSNFEEAAAVLGSIRDLPAAIRALADGPDEGHRPVPG